MVEQNMVKEPVTIDPSRRQAMLRDYAAGNISWYMLREQGFDNYMQVLAGLGELGLRPPIAPMEGPNREARERGRGLLRELLRHQPVS
jgi:hypothetical protein